MGAQGAQGAPSDIRLKKNIRKISDVYIKTLKLEPVKFQWEDTPIIKDVEFIPGHPKYDLESTNIGFISQEVEKIFPKIVHEEYGDIKFLEYGLMVSLGFASIQEQQKIIDDIFYRINNLKISIGG
jgi:uncharacterized Rmd1/YagE family protein